MEATGVIGEAGSASEHGTAIHGYSRAEVDEFLAAAAIERERLEREIADARARISRARSALGMHRVMVAMMLETQRELSELRMSAERRAAEIVADAEREQARLGSRPSSVADPSSVATPAMIDLERAEHVDSWATFGAPTPDAPTGASTASQHGEDYFDFLRGALADDSPLGPIAE
jgi:hypothetical protein